MTKVQLVKAIVKLFFVGALVGSFLHIIETAGKLGLTGWEAWSTPFMVDGIMVIGMVMRSAAFSQRTRQLGLRVMVIMGAVSMAANIYAGLGVVGKMLYGFMIVALYIVAELLGERLEGVEADHQREAEAKKAAAVAKAKVTRAANQQQKANTARAKKAAATRQAKMLEEMITN